MDHNWLFPIRGFCFSRIQLAHFSVCPIHSKFHQLRIILFYVIESQPVPLSQAGRLAGDPFPAGDFLFWRHVMRPYSASGTGCHSLRIVLGFPFS